ncbi:MAG: hypothetical protein U9N51_09755 [Bacteroidota bacterium]|nr:hypothetical protein [Bacteroidota bacterium]
MQNHSFHIPVMGVAYTIDTPLRVAHLGIDSVVSLLDDVLLEKLRKVFSANYNQAFEAIKPNDTDSRAKRITSYLNLMNKVSEEKFEDLKNASRAEFMKYINLLPKQSPVFKEFKQGISQNLTFDNIRNRIKKKMTRGSIDVNIMTKVDKAHYDKDGQMPAEFNDAHAALRGFAKSDLESSVVFSAGMNPRLYSYIEKFRDFFPDKEMNLKKKITLKVSDFRSAMIQGKFLAKKGIWVSEYRIESGLNCGGHAFATDGFLLGPVLTQFKEKRDELVESVHGILSKALKSKSMPIPEKPLPLKITAQGGVGTHEEHDFLINQYGVNSVGWGTPFLLVPEAVCIDNDTVNKLAEAKQDDLFLSDISPLGVPFNNLRSNTKDIDKRERIANKVPGSPCPRKYISLNKEFSEKGICTASRTYQKQKIKALDAKQLSTEEYKLEYQKIVEKSCICVGLGTTALIQYDIPHTTEGDGVSVCPGPNMKFFNKQMSLNEMTDHIYGRKDVMNTTNRPHMFLNELDIYINYLHSKIESQKTHATEKDKTYYQHFANNLLSGISYYRDIFPEIHASNPEKLQQSMTHLDKSEGTINQMIVKIQNASIPLLIMEEA